MQDDKLKLSEDRAIRFLEKWLTFAKISTSASIMKNQGKGIMYFDSELQKSSKGSIPRGQGLATQPLSLVCV